MMDDHEAKNPFDLNAKNIHGRTKKLKLKHFENHSL